MPKKTTTSARGERRHNPLHEELVEDESAGVRKVARQKRRDRDERDNDGAGYYEISAAAQRMAAEQQDEVAAEARPRPALGSGFDAMAARFDAEEDDDEEEDGAGYDDEWEDEGVEEIEEVVEVDEADAALFERFCGSGGGAGAGGDDSDGEGPEQRPSLADIILAKISEHEARAAAAGSSGGRGALADGGQQQAQALPPKVIEVYTQVGLLLSRYKSGRLPKAFKIIPTLRNWEEILYLTRPDKWTPHATFEATKIFAAQNSNQAQRFNSIVLLDRVRDDIDEHKKLNVHLYNALKKSLYKPAAFFKGFLFPLAMSGCTLKEALIISSVLTRVSVPALHSAAALLRLCEMPYAPATAVFIKILIDKKYALPYRAIDALVFYWMRYRTEPEPMPVLWHQGFLAFAQRYKNDITEDQRDALLDVLLVKGHEKIAPEIRRELLLGRDRGVEEPPLDEDDVMLD